MRRHPTPVARTWQATPALLSDVAHEPALRDAAMAAIDTQLSAELPLEYHALSVAQRVLRIAARRDAAFKVPAPSREPPPKLHASASDAARAAWESEAAEYRRHLEDEWWPEFQHHAFMVAVNRHVHVHMATCTQGKRGKTGCRMCADWPHDVESTRLVELEVQTRANGPTCPPCGVRGPAGSGGFSIRCECCYADKALADVKLTAAQRNAKVLKEDNLRDIFYTAHAPTEPAPAGSAIDPRILAVDLRRRLLPIDERGAGFRPLHARTRVAGRDGAPAGDGEEGEPPPGPTPAEEEEGAETADELADFVRRAHRCAASGAPLKFDEKAIDDAAVRGQMRRLLAPGQRLRRLLDHDDCRAARERLLGLCEPPVRACYPLRVCCARATCACLLQAARREALASGSTRAHLLSPRMVAGRC